MGIHYSPKIVLSDRTFSNLNDQGDLFVVHLRDKLLDAGWTQEDKIMSHIKFTAFAIAGGDTITLGGIVFTWYDTTPSGSNPVLRGSSNLDAITNLGAVVFVVLEWTYEIGGTVGNPSIEWEVKDTVGDDDYTANFTACSSFPGGGVGLFDNNADNIAGTGRTWGGGYTMSSGAVLGGSKLTLNIVTDVFINLTFRAPILIATSNGIAEFNLRTDNTWRLIASKYQFVLLIQGSTGNGTFMLASHMYPAPGFLYANYITGPANVVIPSGGQRNSFQSIGQRYYVDVGAPYLGVNTGDNSTNPAICMPGYGVGVTPTQKLSNRLAGLDIIKDDGNAYPFDTWVAACLHSGLSLADFAHLGMLWDSAIYSAYDAPDSVVDIDGENGMVIMSQVGATGNSRGALVMLTETHVIL